MKKFTLAVLMGGISSERDVSLVSGKHVFEALSKSFDCEAFRLDKNELPQGLDGARHIVFPAMHGEYGEDGTLQAQLEEAGIAYAGSDSLSSRVCMNKAAAKALLKQAEIPVAREILFDAAHKPDPKAALSLLGENLILKPADKGSSVGLSAIKSAAELEERLAEIGGGLWLLEEFFKGREFSVGVLYGSAAGIVEIIPEGGVYDFKRKYTAGATRYEFPAKISSSDEIRIKDAAERAFKACGCRDFARVDFILNGEGQFIVLELNTLPGMTPTSLLPKSASCAGYTFESLCAKMLEGAIARF